MIESPSKERTVARRAPMQKIDTDTFGNGEYIVQFHRPTSWRSVWTADVMGPEIEFVASVTLQDAPVKLDSLLAERVVGLTVTRIRAQARKAAQVA